MNNKFVFWLVCCSIIGITLYLVSTTLAPFIISFIFAYLFQPLIDNNCKRFGLPRSVVSFAVFILFISAFILMLILIIPIMYEQIEIFIQKIPYYKDNFTEAISGLTERLNNVDPRVGDKITESLENFINGIFAVIASLANHLWDYTMATINFLTIIVLVPVILYYFLRDWPLMVSSINSVLPMKEKNKVREIFISINQLLSAYIRGQLNICILLSIYYSICLSLVGLDLALLLGILSGFSIIIPFVGAIISFLLIAITSYFTFGLSIKLLYIFIIFVIAHVMEGYILTPRIIGKQIGLHPVWIIFAVFAGGGLFGFVGILFAVPVAGIIKVLVTHLLKYYKSSKIYTSSN